jgi:hypothetical protein
LDVVEAAAFAVSVLELVLDLDCVPVSEVCVVAEVWVVVVGVVVLVRSVDVRLLATLLIWLLMLDEAPDPQAAAGSAKTARSAATGAQRVDSVMPQRSCAAGASHHPIGMTLAARRLGASVGW